MSIDRPPDRLPPSAVDEERAALGSVLIDRDAIVKIADLVEPSDFARPDHRLIFGEMLALYERHEPIDLLTLSSSLDAKGRLRDVGGDSYLVGLINATPTAVNVEAYAQVVVDRAMSRRIIEVAGRIADVGYAGLSGAEALDRAGQLLFGLSRRDPHRWLPLQALLRDAVDHLEKLADPDRPRGLVTGVATGYPALDAMTGGLQPQDLIILAARPSIGKTGLALNIAVNAALAGRVVGLFSLEMGSRQIGIRILGSHGEVDASLIRTGNLSGDDFGRILEAQLALRDAGIHVDDSPELTPMELRTKARRLQAERGLDLVIVDYLQLMRVPRERGEHANRVQEVSQITRQAKALARELDVPVLALSQLSRQMEKEAREPRLDDLRESGSIEQDADVVMFLWRAKDSDDEGDEVTVNLKIAKQRNGPTGRLGGGLTFQRSWTRFIPPRIQEAVW